MIHKPSSPASNSPGKQQKAAGNGEGEGAGIVPHRCQLILSGEFHTKCHLVSDTVDNQDESWGAHGFLSGVPKPQMRTPLPTQASLPHSNSSKHLPRSYLHLEGHRPSILHLLRPFLGLCQSGYPSLLLPCG